MRHREITATVVAGIDRLLDQQRPCAEIATRLGVSEYLVGVIAGDRIGRQRRRPPVIVARKAPAPLRCTDAATIRMIHRMLQVNMLPQRQIAVEAGVSRRMIERIVAGERVPISSEHPFVFEDLGEHFLNRPVRCDQCGAMISIVPCRACRALCS